MSVSDWPGSFTRFSRFSPEERAPHTAWNWPHAFSQQDHAQNNRHCRIDRQAACTAVSWCCKKSSAEAMLEREDQLTSFWRNACLRRQARDSNWLSLGETQEPVIRGEFNKLSLSPFANSLRRGSKGGRAKSMACLVLFWGASRSADTIQEEPGEGCTRECLSNG